jgi:hypothetical protein
MRLEDHLVRDAASTSLTVADPLHWRESVEGVAVETLETGTVLVVTTHHNCYRLVVLDGMQRRALVTGGSFFPEAIEARVEGATAGGTALKVGWIGVGLKLELSIGLQHITTSRVQSIVIRGRHAATAAAWHYLNQVYGRGILGIASGVCVDGQEVGRYRDRA